MSAWTRGTVQCFHPSTVLHFLWLGSKLLHRLSTYRAGWQVSFWLHEENALVYSTDSAQGVRGGSEQQLSIRRRQAFRRREAQVHLQKQEKLCHRCRCPTLAGLLPSVDCISSNLTKAYKCMHTHAHTPRSVLPLCDCRAGFPFCSAREISTNGSWQLPASQLPIKLSRQFWGFYGHCRCDEIIAHSG